MSSKKVGKPEKKIGEREKLRKALPLKESVEVIKLIERAGFVKNVSLARHISSSITYRNCPMCERTEKAHVVLNNEVISVRTFCSDGNILYLLSNTIASRPMRLLSI